jgi:hypothetical protein
VGAAFKITRYSIGSLTITATLLAVAPCLGTTPASAAGGSASGSGGLALAALVAANSPTLASQSKKVMAALLDGKLGVAYPAGKKISVVAAGIRCSAGNVDISSHSCTLTFGKKKVTLAGRKAHEIYATLVEVGVPSDGAAGTIYESLTNLNCSVVPSKVKERDGSGVSCKFDSGAS